MFVSKEREIMQNLLDFIKEIQTNDRYASFDEAAVKQGIVLRLLSLLDWDPFNPDEIHPEHDAGEAKVAFSLRHKNADKVFVAVHKGIKTPQKTLEQLVKSAAQAGVKLVVLTDGVSWWFLLPLLGEDLEEKTFCTLDVKRQSAKEIGQYFLDFLSKQNVISGKAVKAAEDIYLTKQKDSLIKEHLPKAWKKLMSEPEKWLGDILAEMTKELCGYLPDNETVEEFIASEVDIRADLSSTQKPKPVPSAPSSQKAPQADDYTGRSIVSFSLKGKKYDVKSWKAMLLKLCEIILPKYKEELDILLTLSGADKEYFSKNPYEFLTSEQVAGTDIYVNVGLSATEVVNLSQEVLTLFGLNSEDLSIETK